MVAAFSHVPSFMVRHPSCFPSLSLSLFCWKRTIDRLNDDDGASFSSRASHRLISHSLFINIHIYIYRYCWSTQTMESFVFPFCIIASLETVLGVSVVCHHVCSSITSIASQIHRVVNALMNVRASFSQNVAADSQVSSSPSTVATTIRRRDVGMRQSSTK